jgi:hypothetical protein
MIGVTVWVEFHVDLIGSDLRMTGKPEDVPPLARGIIPKRGAAGIQGIVARSLLKGNIRHEHIYVGPSDTHNLKDRVCQLRLPVRRAVRPKQRKAVTSRSACSSWTSSSSSSSGIVAACQTLEKHPFERDCRTGRG